jgi:hypothetical protein
MAEDHLLTREIVLQHQDLITKLAPKRRETLVSSLRGDDPHAVALWALALVYCGHYATGGFVPETVIEALINLPQDLKTLALSLVDVALRQD